MDEREEESATRSRVEALIRDIPDHPAPGVVFKDISPVLADGEVFGSVIDWLAAPYAGEVDIVAAIEARGFIFGAPVAHVLGAGFVPVRKMGKLPGVTVAQEYALEYGRGTLEVQADVLLAGHRVVIIDDVIATGGTITATIELVRHSHAVVVGIAALLSIAALGGIAKLAEFDRRVLVSA